MIDEVNSEEEWVERHLVWGVEHVNRVDLEPSSEEEERDEDARAFIKTCSQPFQDQHEALRRDLRRWATQSAKLVGDLFGQKEMEDAWDKQIVFDDDNKVWCFEEDGGVTVMHDVTLGLRMAMKSGLTEKQAAEVVSATVESATRVCRGEETG